MSSQNDRNRKLSEAYSSSSSAQSNFSVLAQQQQRPSYVPGSGAAFMAQSGWSNRDEYGRARQSNAFPVFTPASRLPQQQQQAAAQRRFGGGASQESPPHQVTFSEAPNYKKVYLIALLIVSLLLFSLIAAIVVLLTTKVFIYNSARSPSPLPGVMPPQIPSSPSPTPFLPPPMPMTTNQPHLVTRTFECEFYILDQANQAYDKPNSFEQYQAQTIIQNALVNTFEGSSLRDMNPTIGLEKLENSVADLRIVFRLSIVVLEQNTGLGELAIRNLLLSEAGVLEGLLNRTSLDRSRVSVRLIS